MCSRPLLESDRVCPDCGATAAPILLPDPVPVAPSPWDEMVERLRRATAGEFEIGPELGRGGMAAVFQAHDLALDRQVAIKVMSPAVILGDGMTERFRQEAVTIARLHHPHIVPVYAVRHGEGLHYFVMRYVRGRSAALAMPKSVTTASPSSSIRMLAGLMSRCTTPARWA